jgi:predicted metal-dependent enzyme (double-stranded beta helix superfamily)
MAPITTQKAHTLLSIQEFTSELRRVSAPAFDRVDEIHDFLRTHPVNPDTLTPYLVWDRQHYTRNLIDKTPLYELMAICWEVGQVSSIHNHRDQNCWMAAPLGRLKVQNYRVLWQDEVAGKCKIEPTNLLEINQENPVSVDPLQPVHRVFNPAELNHRAVSLHVYSRPFDSCVVYSDQQGTCGTIKLHYTTEYGKK